MQSKLAILFPGQGAHSFEMFDSIANHPTFKRLYPVVCDIIESFPLKEFKKRNSSYLNQNLISSICTVLASIVSYDSFSNKTQVGAFTGYSVGQYTALFQNGMFSSFEDLCLLLKKRSALMDECFIQRKGAMCSVIGLDEQTVANVCDELRSNGLEIYISNYNCYGQYSLAGEQNVIQRALQKFEELQAKKVLLLPVSGAWHSPMLNEASTQFRDWLENISFNEGKLPIIDNVTGNFLNTKESGTLKKALANHISFPVLWEKGVQQLIEHGFNEFVEIGYGQVLTKFGFFINRKVKYKNYYAE